MAKGWGQLFRSWVSPVWLVLANATVVELEFRLHLMACTVLKNADGHSVLANPLHVMLLT